MAAEWYKKHEKDITAALKRSKTVGAEDAVACTLVKMPDGSHALCAGAAPAKVAAQVKDARSNGGKILSAGTLYNGPDGATFAVTQGSAAVKKQFSEAAAEATGKAMHVHIIAAGEAAPEPSAATNAAAPPAPPPSPTPADAADQVKDRLMRLVPAVKQAAPAVQAAVQPLLIQAITLSKSNRHAEAAPLLDRVEKGLSAAPTAPPPPPAAPVPPPPPAAGAAAEFRARAKQLTAGLAAAAPGVQAGLKPRLVQALALAKDERYAEAVPLLDEVEKGLKGAAGSPPPVPPPPPAPDKARFMGRVKPILQRYQEAVAAAPDRKAELGKIAADASNAGKANDFAAANALLDKLEGALKAPSSVPPAPPDVDAKSSGAPVSIAALQRCRLQWEAARKKAQDEIIAFQQTALAKAKDDPALGAVTEVVRRYDEAKGAFDGNLTDKLDEALNAADPAKRLELNREAGRMIREYQAYVGADPLLKVLQTNPFVKLTFPDALSKTLGELAALVS